ncbi:Acyl-CoA dehydrogenase, C-terminal domain [Jatrophihabitans endophyticus]|uniref:Acyl-CoA dehydrogenase, C-terminal domain n=1 Tax=Jatrophihabitans endophyticus TaxID=1206085 RepID=A0A1M5PS25_9ACTN|nr:acyl-CoA dehydrogenase family protein [Jatrophihabitans endophyticus]SHH04697.1 Acyl-CoA dehydrogenase, C-terminal domain [Jatrophihabitans endophyticus]
MRTVLADEATEFAAVVERAVRRAGGFELVARAERGEPAADEVERAFAELGVWDLRARDGDVDAEVAAAVCRSAGRWALPYPVAERLAGHPAAGYDAVALATARGPRINLHRDGLRWLVSDGLTSTAPVTSVGEPLGTKLGSLVRDAEVGAWSEDADVAPLSHVFGCWVLLGMCETALDLTRQHLLDRHQFGKPLASFQALQFRLADTAAALQGFGELAKYTLWSVTTAQVGRAGDALALRLSALETAETVFRTAHQLHGAMGFCDEVPLSWLSRYSQPIRRLPWGRSETEVRLLQAIETVPFAGLFSSGDAGAILVQ